MSLKEKLKEDLKTAMKAKDTVKLSSIRMANSAIRNKEIEVKRELEDSEIEALLASEVKKRREAMEQYKNAGREDLAQKEEAEMAVFMSYMPEQMSEEDLRKIVRETIGETGASGMKDMGAVMKAIMPKVKGRADGSAVNRLVKEELGG